MLAEPWCDPNFRAGISGLGFAQIPATAACGFCYGMTRLSTELTRPTVGILGWGKSFALSTQWLAQLQPGVNRSCISVAVD
jgi:hypothetical protein